MKSRSLSLLTFLVVSSTPVFGVNINYSGQIETLDLTSFNWVLGSMMWGTISTSTSTATSQSGFNSLASADMSKFQWTFGQLSLTNHLEPTTISAGFEYYTGVAQPFVINYNGNMLASGNVLYLQTDAVNSNDQFSTGTGRAQLTTAGTDATFYNEVMSLTNNTGLLEFHIDSFVAVSAPGQVPGIFNSTGVMTPVPEPAYYASALATICLLIGIRLRRR